MANQQGTPGSGMSSGQSTGTRPDMQGRGGITGVDNATFKLISVVYHALQGAGTLQ